MTATTRETVTRLLAQLRRKRVISIRGSDLIIRDRKALERLAV
jgi:CRP-like cAMP-binding protein